MKMKPCLRFCLCLALLTGGFGSALAQGTASRVTGVVTDPSGAVVPEANVTLTNEGTQVSFTTQTTSTGTYVFDSVQVGKYTVTVEKQGFKKTVSTSNPVNVNVPATVDVTLEIGGVNDVVTVTGTAALVQTSSSGNFGNTVEQRSLEALPIVGTRGRNPLNFIDIQPGVQVGSNTGGGVHVHGARDRAFNFTLDGIDINESSAGGSDFTPIRTNPDSISEFQVVTSNFTAELGRSSGAQVSLITRSGTNDFHGTLFELYRTPGLNANEYENNLNGRPKGQFLQHIFGGSVGGPVYLPRFGEGGKTVYDGHNKTFFFVNVQLLRASQSILAQRTVYTAEARRGLFRYRTGGTANAPAGTSTASVDANGNPIVPIATYNVVASDPLCLTQPTNCGLDPATQALINLTPLPNSFFSGDGLNTAGFNFAATSTERQHDFSAKVDHTFNERNTMYVRYSQGAQNTIADNGNGGLPAFPNSTANFVDTFRNPKNLAVNYRWTPSSRITNELVVGGNKYAFSFNNPDPNANSNPPFTFSNITDPLNATPPINNRRQITTYQLADNISYLRGSHTYRAGVNLRYQKHDDIRSSVGGLNTNEFVNFSRTVNPVPNTGAFSFNLPATTGTNPINSNDRNRLQSAINELLGRVGNIQQAFVAQSDSAFAPPGTLFQFNARYGEYDFYVQDTWKFRPNLTIDYGLRWEPKITPHAANGSRILVPDRSVKLGAPPSDQIKFVEGKLYDSDLTNFAPTIGFAWDPFKDGKTSIRANYRLAYDRMNTFVTSSSIFPNTPGTATGVNDATFAARANEASRIRFGLPSIVPTTTPGALRQPPAFSTNSLTVFDPSTRSPKTNEWGLSIQRELGRRYVVEVNYIGRRGVGLFGGYDVNQVDIFNNSFLAAFNTLRNDSTATSPLIDQLLASDTRRGTQSGSAFFRSLFTTELTQGSVASTAVSLSQRLNTTGQRTIVASGFSPFFFQPYPQFAGALNVLDSNDISTYHGLEAQISRRAGRGLLLQASYTLSKSLDTRSFDPTFSTVSRNNAQSASSTPFDKRDRHLNYARSDFDRRHVFQGYLVYDLPFGRRQRFLSDAPAILNQIVGGWEVANLFTVQSGRPFTVYSGINTVSNSVQATANCTGCTPNLGHVVQESGTNFFFTADQRARFSFPAPGQLGNTGRNFFTAPRVFDLDMTLRKRFYFSEQRNLEFRADVQNLTNTPSFGLPTATFTNSVFGRIRDGVVSSSRRIQLGVKFYF